MDMFYIGYALKSAKRQSAPGESFHAGVYVWTCFYAVYA
jgi:hypothetical protein